MATVQVFHAGPSNGGTGTPAGTGVTAREYGTDAVHKTVLTFTNAAVTLADNPGVVAYGSLKIYDFPEGYLQFIGCTANIAVTKSSAGVNADWDGDFGVGSVAANSGAGPLVGAEQTYINSIATPQAVAGATTATGVSSNSLNIQSDGHTTPIDLYVNFLVDDADHDVTGTPCNLILNGSLTFTWVNLGDF